jgi:hypothetical protein
MKNGKWKVILFCFFGVLCCFLGGTAASPNQPLLSIDVFSSMFGCLLIVVLITYFWKIRNKNENKRIIAKYFFWIAFVIMLIEIFSFNVQQANVKPKALSPEQEALSIGKDLGYDETEILESMKQNPENTLNFLRNQKPVTKKEDIYSWVNIAALLIVVLFACVAAKPYWKKIIGLLFRLALLAICLGIVLFVYNWISSGPDVGNIPFSQMTINIIGERIIQCGTLLALAYAFFRIIGSIYNLLISGWIESTEPPKTE